MVLFEPLAKRSALLGVDAGEVLGLEVVLADDKVDAVVTILILAEELGIPDLAFLPALAERYPEKPIYVSFSGDHAANVAAKEFLEPRGIATFPLIEDPFKALDILVRCRKALSP